MAVTFFAETESDGRTPTDEIKARHTNHYKLIVRLAYHTGSPMSYFENIPLCQLRVVIEELQEMFKAGQQSRKQHRPR